MMFAAKKSIEHAFQVHLDDHKATLNQQLESHKSELRTTADKDISEFKSNLDRTAAQQLATYKATLDVQTGTMLEYLKSRFGLDAQTRLAIAAQRLPSYRAFWSLMEVVSPMAKNPLSERVRLNLDVSLRTCFFENSNGILLTHEGLTKYLEAIKLLRDDSDKIDDKEIRDAFSRLRTQMKTDLAIYTEEEARTPNMPKATANSDI